jgi:hypothetical protein
VRRPRRSHTPQANDVLSAAGISPEHLLAQGRRSRAEAVAREWCVYGAERLQPVATGGKCGNVENGSDSLGQHFPQHSGRLLAVAAYAASPVIGLVWPFRLLGDLHCPQSVRLCKPEVTGSIRYAPLSLEVPCG